MIDRISMNLEVFPNKAESFRVSELPHFRFLTKNSTKEAEIEYLGSQIRRNEGWLVKITHTVYMMVWYVLFHIVIDHLGKSVRMRKKIHVWTRESWDI